MPNVLRNVLAILAGLVIGSAVNFAVITIGPMIIPPPAGVDVTTAEGLSKGMHLFEPKHFLTPFLAHALGTLIGALAAYLIAVSYKVRLAFVVGALFLCGGIAASILVPAPVWYIAVDLLAAYLPMAWLGINIGSRVQKAKTA